MKRVKIVFFMEPTDEDHSTGLTSEDYDDLIERLMHIGAEDYEIDLVEEEDPEPVTRRAKP